VLQREQGVGGERNSPCSVSVGSLAQYAAAMTAARPSSVLILHGWQNHRPAKHWQHVLADDLQAAGVDVRYPQLPDPNHPDPGVWRALVAAEISGLTGEHRTVIAHSLSIWVVLDLLVAGGLDVERILLAAPVTREVLAVNPPITAFDPSLDDAEISSAVRSQGNVHLVCSDDDPYWPGGAAEWAGDIGATVHSLTGQGHLALGDGYGRWDSVRDWVLEGSHIGPR
jgi:predicted alpha/beta hydrolase family esterase